ncbi:MAG: DUF4240 domain-containing protein [Candidatus Lokiarchaeota archaeon]|nr:DUF4240 domain-containing protein [Candidatus Lokiarchaeota archaeon]
MDDSEFWNIIDKSSNKTNDQEEQYENLKDILKNYESEDIISFNLCFAQKTNELYRWDLWAVAYIINHGCSDDSFKYFRNWIISRGKDFFNDALIQPKKIGEVINIDDKIFFKEIGYVADNAYEEKTGEDVPDILDRFPKHPDNPDGDYWEEEDLEKLYPKLCKKFGW